MGNFSSVFKTLRLKSGLTQQEMAEKLKISRSSIGMYENGEREPSFELLESIADFFNVDMNYLLGKSELSQNIPYPYYYNDETAQAAQEIFENKELRALFDVQRDMDPEDLKALHNMALALKRKEHNDDGT